MNRTIPRVSTFSLPLLAFFIRYTSRINRWPLQQAGDAPEFNPAFDSDFESRGISFRFPSFGKRERIFSPTFEKLSLYLYVFYYRYYFFSPTAVSRSFEHLLIEKKWRPRMRTTESPKFHHRRNFIHEFYTLLIWHAYHNWPRSVESTRAPRVSVV